VSYAQSDDGHFHRCRACDRELHKQTNDRTNGITRLAAQIVGGSRALFSMDKAERMKVRSVAAQMYDNGQDFATAQAREATDKRGFVYVIAHPAFPEYVKIGRAFDPESRLSGYQTGCPRRAYELKYAVYFEDCHTAERLIHDTLADYRAEGEWFRMLPTVAEHVLDEIGGYI